MANKTTNYNLTKPLPEEFYDINVHNENMDIIDEQLKRLSEASGVVISPDEPEKGDVWIDTDDNDSENGSDLSVGVISINGKTGEVNLTAKDLDAYTVGETYSKTEANELLNKKAGNDHKHSIEDINAGTLPVERGGTGIGVNPSMLVNLASTAADLVFTERPRPGITGILPISNGGTGSNNLEGALKNAGYNKFASGKYVGDGATYGNLTGSQYTSSRKIELPFKPTILLIFELNAATHSYQTEGIIAYVSQKTMVPSTRRSTSCCGSRSWGTSPRNHRDASRSRSTSRAACPSPRLSSRTRGNRATIPRPCGCTGSPSGA